MKRTSAALLALVSLFALGASPAAATEQKPLPKEIPPFGQDRPLPAPRILKSTTPEGLTVWLVPREGFPKVTALLAVRGGTAADPKGVEGTGQILADLLKEGTGRRSSQQIAEELQAIGGSISAGASDDAITVGVDGLAAGTDRILEILADVARGASFPAAEVELAKANTLQQLQVKESTPEFLSEKALAAAVFGEHPYRIVAPTAEAVQKVDRGLLKSEFARRFRSDGALLVVVGAFDAEAARKTVARAFGGWKGDGPAVPDAPPLPAPKAREILFVGRPGSVQSNIALGRTAPGLADPSYFPGVLANTIYGGSFASRLTQNIREEKGYTYSPHASFTTFRAGGSLRTSAEVRNEVTAASLVEIFYELDRMGTTDVTVEELTGAKRLQTGLYLLRNQVQGSVASALATYWVKGMPPEFFSEYVGKVNAVTTADVREAGRTLFPSRLQTVVVVGEESVKKDLGQLGAVRDVKP
jgi:predicted Zn-dependent peptidase